MPVSSASTRTDPGPNPLGLEDAPPFVAPKEPQPAQAEPEPDYRPAPQDLLEWTPERCGFLVRGGGLLLHTADSLSREPEGADLWKATAEDLDAIAPPLSRILNRYEPARRLAGLADEGELALGLAAYVRHNLVDRGQIVAARSRRLEQAEAAQAAEPWPDRPADHPLG